MAVRLSLQLCRLHQAHGGQASSFQGQPNRRTSGAHRGMAMAARSQQRLTPAQARVTSYYNAGLVTDYEDGSSISARLHQRRW